MEIKMKKNEMKTFELCKGELLYDRIQAPSYKVAVEYFKANKHGKGTFNITTLEEDKVRTIRF
jgi:hypothetical protein